MGGVYEETFIAEQKLLTNWWKQLPAEYEIVRWTKEKILPPEDLSDFNLSRGLLWHVTAKGYPASKIFVSLWQPKGMDSEKIRIDIDWRHSSAGIASSKTTAEVVKLTLISLKAEPKK